MKINVPNECTLFLEKITLDSNEILKLNPLEVINPDSCRLPHCIGELLIHSLYLFRRESVMGPLAQSVEQRTFNPWVVGSIPTGPTSRAEYHFLDARRKLCMYQSKK